MLIYFLWYEALQIFIQLKCFALAEWSGYLTLSQKIGLNFSVWLSKEVGKW
jgi:hypothetical protein